MSTTGKVLAVNVAVLGEDGRTRLWRRGETPPPQVAAKLGAHVFVGGEHVLRAAGTPSLQDVRHLAGAPVPTASAAPDDTPASAQQPYTTGGTPEVPAPASESAQQDQPAPAGGDGEPSGEAEAGVGDAGEDDGQGEGAEPPRSGVGATAAAWRAYARDLGQDVDDDTPRDAVIHQLIDAGLIEK